MERVAFLVEETGRRIDCLLNPESVEVTRLSGLRHKGVGSGRLGARLADDPVHFTGGGRTELTLDLLFDVDLVESERPPADVRVLTRVLWQLAENSATEDGAVRPPLVRFVWGKSWNIPGVVAAVAERFDRFTAEGSPRRSWLRMRFLRVADSAEKAEEEYQSMLAEARAAQNRVARDPDGGIPAGEAVVSIGVGGGESGIRLDALAADALGNPFLWRLLAAYNDIDDPMAVEAGTVIAIPPELSSRAGVSGGEVSP